MRHPTLKASPKMIARMAGFYAPLTEPAVLPIAVTKAKPDVRQPDMLDPKAERQDDKPQT